MTDLEIQTVLDAYDDSSQIYCDDDIVKMARDYLALKAAVREFIETIKPPDIPTLNRNLWAGKKMRELALDQQEPPHAE